MPQIIRTDDIILRLIKDVNDIQSALRRVVANLPLYDISNENTPAQIVANQNNYVPGNYDVLRLSTDAARTITGFTGGVKGRFLRLFNIGTFEITIPHQSGLSLAANRVVSATGQDIVLPPNEQLLLYYDNSVQRWITAWASNADRISCQLRLTVAQSIPDITYHDVSWETAVIDTGSFWNVGTPTIITIPETGWYQCSAQIVWDVNATKLRETIIMDNTGICVVFDSRLAVANAYTNVSINRTLYRIKGSTMKVRVWQDSGAPLDIRVNRVGVNAPVYTEFIIAKM